jgi:tetratricopeptide (TPR) repeat protein
MAERRARVRIRATAIAASAAMAIAVLSAAPRASAAPGADVPASPEHEAAFRSGLDQYGQGNYIAAIATWETLLSTMGEERGYKVLYNLGLAYQAIGDVTKAIERYRAFGKQVGARPYAAADLVKRADDANKRATQLELTHGAVHVLAPKRGGLVLTRLGSSDPRAAGYVVWLSPGPHILELFVGTDHARTMTIEVEAAKSIDIDTSPPPTPGAAPPPASAQGPAPEKASPPSNTVVWVLGGATVVSLAAPIALYFVASGKSDDASALGAGNTGYADARATYVSWRTGYYVSYALPAALALATAAVLVLRPSARTTVGVAPTSITFGATF